MGQPSCKSTRFTLLKNASPVVNLDCACCVDKLMVREASKALSEFKGSLEEKRKITNIKKSPQNVIALPLFTECYPQLANC